MSLGDLELNADVLTWPQRINPIFDRNEELIEASKIEGEKHLLEKKEKVGSLSGHLMSKGDNYRHDYS